MPVMLISHYITPLKCQNEMKTPYAVPIHFGLNRVLALIVTSLMIAEQFCTLRVLTETRHNAYICSLVVQGSAPIMQMNNEYTSPPFPLAPEHPFYF